MIRMHLGWLQLKKEKLRSGVALAGVCFAVTMILMQLGFQSALFESAVRYHEAMEYEVALLSPETSYIAMPRPFSRRRLHQVRALEGVRSVTGIYAQQALWKNPWTGQTRQIFAVGFDPSARAFDPALFG
jgi:putative ABC transport system permease protein